MPGHPEGTNLLEFVMAQFFLKETAGFDTIAEAIEKGKEAGIADPEIFVRDNKFFFTIPGVDKLTIEETWIGAPIETGQSWIYPKYTIDSAGNIKRVGEIVEAKPASPDPTLYQTQQEANQVLADRGLLGQFQVVFQPNENGFRLEAVAPIPPSQFPGSFNSQQEAEAEAPPGYTAIRDPESGRWFLQPPVGQAQTFDPTKRHEVQGGAFHQTGPNSFSFLRDPEQPDTFTPGATQEIEGIGTLVQTSANQWQLVRADPDPLPPAEVERIGTREFIREGGGELTPLRTQTLDDIITQALIDGQFDAALAFADFRDRPTAAEAFNTALQFARSPADQTLISALARGEGPVAQPTSPTRVGPQPDFLIEAFNDFQRRTQAGSFDAESAQKFLTRFNQGLTPELEAERAKVQQEVADARGELELAKARGEAQSFKDKLEAFETAEAKRKTAEAQAERDAAAANVPAPAPTAPAATPGPTAESLGLQFGGSIGARALQDEFGQRLSQADVTRILTNLVGLPNTPEGQALFNQFVAMDFQDGRLVAIPKHAPGTPSSVAVKPLTEADLTASGEAFAKTSIPGSQTMSQFAFDLLTPEQQAAFQGSIVPQFIPPTTQASEEDIGGPLVSTTSLSTLARSTEPIDFGAGLLQSGGFNDEDLDSFAKGGTTHHNHLEIVGEDGPELVDLPNGTRVIPLKSLSKKQVKALKKKGTKGFQTGGIVFDDLLPLGIRQLQAGRAITPPRGRLLRAAGLPLPSAQALQNLTPESVEVFFDLGRQAGIPAGAFAQELQAATPAGRRLSQSRLRPLVFSGVR